MSDKDTPVQTPVETEVQKTEEITVPIVETVSKRKRGRPKKIGNMAPTESQRQRILAQSQAKKMKTTTKATTPIKIASYADLAANKAAAAAKARAKEEQEAIERQKLAEEKAKQERLEADEAVKTAEKLKAQAVQTKWIGKRPRTAWDLQALMYFLDNKRYHGYEKTAEIFNLNEEDLRAMMTYIRAQPTFPDNLPKVVWTEEQTKDEKQTQAKTSAATSTGTTADRTTYNIDQVCHATAAHLYHHLTKRYDDRLKKMETILAIA